MEIMAIEPVQYLGVPRFVAAVLMMPVITIIGIEAAFLIGGLIVTETVFNIPGVARFLVEAIQWRDYPIVQNLVMFIALVVVVINFLVDMAYAALDPRGRLLFGAGIGLLIFIIRTWGGYPDGVAFAVLLMNMAAPLIDRYTRPRIYGHD